jgi:hypothetical protein
MVNHLARPIIDHGKKTTIKDIMTGITSTSMIVGLDKIVTHQPTLLDVERSLNL